MQSMKHYLLLAIFYLFSFAVEAQNSIIGKYNVSYLNMSTGLPSNFVDDIYCDSYGFIWIATHGGGLVRYDGFNYMYFGIGNPGMPLRSNTCQNITEDKFHRLWISFEEYTEVLMNCIRLLPKETVIHRLTGDGPKKLLVEPQWSADKKRVLNTIYHALLLNI